MEAATLSVGSENSKKLDAAKRHRKQGLKWLISGVLFFAGAVIYFLLTVQLNMTNAIALLAAYGLIYAAPVAAAIGLIRMFFGMFRIAKLKSQPVPQQ